jgi:hypothetical protein
MMSFLVLSSILGMAVVSTTAILTAQTLHAQFVVKLGGPDTDQVSSRIIGTLLKPGFSNKYNLTVNGKTVPIDYSVLDGSLVGILSDPSRKSLDLAVNPQANGGALEVNVPRHLIDSKNAAGQDAPFIVKIDGSRVTGEPSGICVGTCPNIANSFKETHNTNTDRVLTVLFGPESRFIEVIGNKTASGGNATAGTMSGGGNMTK